MENENFFKKNLLNIAIGLILLNIIIGAWQFYSINNALKANKRFIEEVAVKTNKLDETVDPIKLQTMMLVIEKHEEQIDRLRKSLNQLAGINNHKSRVKPIRDGTVK